MYTIKNTLSVYPPINRKETTMTLSMNKKHVQPVTAKTLEYLKTTDLKVQKNAIIFHIACCVYAMTHQSTITTAQSLALKNSVLYDAIVHLLTTGYKDSCLRSLPPHAQYMINYVWINNPFKQPKHSQ